VSVNRMALVALCSLALVPAAGGCSSNVEATSGAGTGSGSGSGSGGAAATGSGGASNAATGAGGGGGAGGSFDPGAMVTTVDTTIGPLPIDPGQEYTKCITVRLNNAEGAFVRRFRADLHEGSHHLILYRSSATDEAPNAVDCQGFSGIFSGDHPIFIAQQAKSDLVFPKDENGVPVGLEIAPNQMVRIEMHYINTSTQPINVSGDIHIDTVPLSTNVVKSDLAFWGTTNINIPPNSTADTGVKFQRALPDTHSFALTTHQHHFGTRMQVWYGDSANDLSTSVADSSNWSDPPLELFDPPLSFPAGSGGFSSKGFAYKCEWKNTSPNSVGFGEGFNDEMCFLWHYYYPSQGFQACVNGFCPKF